MRKGKGSVSVTGTASKPALIWDIGGSAKVGEDPHIVRADRGGPEID